VHNHLISDSGRVYLFLATPADGCASAMIGNSPEFAASFGANFSISITRANVCRLYPSSLRSSFAALTARFGQPRYRDTDTMALGVETIVETWPIAGTFAISRGAKREGGRGGGRSQRRPHQGARRMRALRPLWRVGRQRLRPDREHPRAEQSRRPYSSSCRRAQPATHSTARYGITRPSATVPLQRSSPGARSCDRSRRPTR